MEQHSLFFTHDEINHARLRDMIRFRYIRAQEAKNGVYFAYLPKGQEKIWAQEVEAFRALCEAQGVSFFLNETHTVFGTKRKYTPTHKWTWAQHLNQEYI